jgi:hypothetical protein
MKEARLALHLSANWPLQQGMISKPFKNTYASAIFAIVASRFRSVNGMPHGSGNRALVVGAEEVLTGPSFLTPFR